MEPVNELLSKSSLFKFDRFDILVGIFPCKLLDVKSISSINSEFSSQITPYHLHHDIVELSQLLLLSQLSPDVDSYKSFNALGTGDNEGSKDGIADNEGLTDGDNEGLIDGIRDDEGLMDGITDNEGLKDGITDNEGSVDKANEGFKLE